MNLVIVESPTKAKTISRFLGDEFVVKASMGHVMDLPKSKLGVDVEHDFTPQYDIAEGKKSTLSELSSLAADASHVILATDPDREGEAIASHIADYLTSRPKGKTIKQKLSRVVFHEITKSAVDEAFTKQGAINSALVNAQTARRVLDRLVGYTISPVLWIKVRRGLSAGRVQSVALRLIVEREREIEKFVSEHFYTLHITFNNQADVVFDLTHIRDEKIDLQQTISLYDGSYTTTKTRIASDQQALEHREAMEHKNWQIADVSKKEMKRTPQPPYTTSTLQQDASRRLSFSGKRTMSIAQKLYEEGYITYHRTDSVHLASSAISAIRSYIDKQFGGQYLPDQPRFYTTKQKMAQEAHEAIRPTRMDTTEERVAEAMGPQFGRLYGLIWRRAVASQMTDARIESTTVIAQTDDSIYRAKTTGSVLLFDGFLRVNPYGLQDTRLPGYHTGETLSHPVCVATPHDTTPPPRYNDASLIKSLEEAGIGRPSTYATIISVLEERMYIERIDARFIPTAIGKAVNDFLVLHFGDIDDVPFTAHIEDSLDMIAQGEREWVPVIRDFYTPLAERVEIVKKDAQRMQIEVEQTGELCPKDNVPLVIRTGRFGKFISCSNYPECDFKKPFLKKTNAICPKDGGDIVARKTKKGRTFYGCANYPTCDFAAWKLTDIKKADASDDDAHAEAPKSRKKAAQPPGTTKSVKSTTQAAKTKKMPAKSPKRSAKISRPA